MCDRTVTGALLAALLLTGGFAAAQELGDPTRPTSLRPAAQAEAVVGQPQWQLYSTLVAKQRRLAVINGQTVREGEMINGARLLEVRPGSVRLERGGEWFELTLRTDAVQRLPPTLTQRSQPGNR